MKKIIFAFSVIFAFLCPPIVRAQEFFDTSEASTFCSFSARLGFNTSNKTFPDGYFTLWNHNSWGTGVNVGGLVNLNFREYLSLQPGLFIESRSGDYAYLTNYLNYATKEDTHYQMGHLRGYYVTIPVMAIVKFNLAENIKWSVELGPYFQWAGRQTGDNNIIVLYRLPQNTGYSQYTAKHETLDAGAKVGTGLQFFQHYYIGMHYLAGFRHTWKQPEGGKNKSWVFTLGYDF